MFSGMVLKDWISVVTSLVGATLIPFTLAGIWRNRVLSREAENWKTRQEEIGTYNDINAKYVEFLKVILDNPEVDVGEFNTPKAIETGSELYKQQVIYAMLVSLMERAFLLYTNIERFEKEANDQAQNSKILVRIIDSAESRLFGSHPDRFQTHIFRTQWPNWVRYFEYYCGHKSFQDYWTTSVSEQINGQSTVWQDSEFERFINGLMTRDKAVATCAG